MSKRGDTGRGAKTSSSAKTVAHAAGTGKQRGAAAKKTDRRKAAEDFIGRDVIGQYVIKEKLGVGGMGAVYLADQVTVSRPAVIKVLRSQFTGSPDIAARFSIEAKAASALNHPNIVTIYNYGEMDDGTLFLAMEYLDGSTLEQLVQKHKHKRLTAERAVRIMVPVARALGEAHRRGVIHRDLKPSNIMVVERAGTPDFVKVLDFGIAKLDGMGVTSAGEIFGTLPYMSPEQLRGQPLDGRSDLYSAGVVLYEMLTGKLPFTADSPTGWLYKHATEEPKRPSDAARIKLSPALEALVMRALAKTPEERATSIDDWANELEQSLTAVEVEQPATARGTGRTTTEKKQPSKKASGPTKKPTLFAAAASLLRADKKPPAGMRAKLGAMFRRKKQKRPARFARRVMMVALGAGVIGLVVLIMLLASGGDPAAAAARTNTVLEPTPAAGKQPAAKQPAQRKPKRNPTN